MVGLQDRPGGPGVVAGGRQREQLRGDPRERRGRHLAQARGHGVMVRLRLGDVLAGVQLGGDPNLEIRGHRGEPTDRSRLVVGRDDLGGHRDHEQVDPVPGDDRPDVRAERGHVRLAVDLRLQGGEPGRVGREERLERRPVAVGEAVGVRHVILEGRDRHEPAVDLAVAERLEVRGAVVLGRRPLGRAGRCPAARGDLRGDR